MKYDFSGWATKNNLRCADGRIIRKGAFKSSDGKKVPLVWNHQHNSASDVLGHAILEDREEGVYTYCSFNNTKAGKDAKETVKHGDVTSLSIWANNLKQDGPDVMHGVIREVSLVLAGANPGAFIESVLAHGEPMDDDADEGIFYNDDEILIHSEEQALEHAEQEMEDNMGGKPEADNEKTVKEVIDSMTDEQRRAMAIFVGQALADAEEEEDEDEEDEDEEGDEEMRHSVFGNEEEQGGAVGYINMDDILHSAMADIKAKRTGSLKEAIAMQLEDEDLIHSIDTTGMTGPSTSTADQSYGFRDPDMLFPEYKSVTGGPPEWISRNMDWVDVVMNGTHHTPFSRIKSMYADITEDEARAKGYIKGKEKKEEVFTLLKRTTDPQTVYKKQKMDRDDIIDISDWDVVPWIKAEMRVMLNEEIARAILIGDGRPSDSDDKIKEDHVRPIVKEPPLFNTVIEVPAGSTNGESAKNMIDESIRGRKKYKGSGNPILFTTEDQLTEMLLLNDNNGHKLYKTEAELATAMRVSRIVTVEVMENQKVDGAELLGIIVNLADYNVGADKGGAISTFEDFDIDFNQMKYLIETRISGALIKPFSALTLVRSGASGASTYSARSRSND